MTPSGTVLDTWYPEPRLGAPEGARAGTTRLGALELSGELGPDYGGLVRRDEARGVEVIAVRTVIPDLSARRSTPTTSGCGCTCSRTG